MKLTPIFRIEKFLDAIINNTTPPEPVFRVEYFLAKIAGADVVTPEPMFRIEKYLAKILGEDVEIPEPMFRTEFWLAKKCGEDVETPDPAFRVEYWLEEWCGGSAPTYETITGKIVSFLTQRIAPLKIEAALSPKQDLHGYDNPWPPGGGKNKFNGAAVTTTHTSNWGVTWDEATATLTIEHKTEYTVGTPTFPLNLPSGTYVASYQSVSDTGHISLYVNGSWVKSLNNGVTFEIDSTKTNEVRAAAVTVTKFQIESGSTASTFAPYSNECPISGHSGAEIYDNNGNWFSNANPQTGVYLSELNAINSFSGWNVSDYIAVKGGTQYYWNPNSTEGQVAKCWFYDADKNGISYISSGARTFTTPSNCRFMRFSYRDTSTDIMLNLGSSASAYVPYSGTSVTLTFGSTVYGCTLAVNEDGTGTVVSTHKKLTFDSNTVWSNYSASVYFTMIDDAKFPSDIICDSYKGRAAGGGGSSRDEGDIWLQSTSTYNRCYVKNSQITSNANAAVVMNGVSVVYELATPITIPLTPGQVEALQGNNTVWVDSSGEIKVTFRSN